MNQLFTAEPEQTKLQTVKSKSKRIRWVIEDKVINQFPNTKDFIESTVENKLPLNR